MGHGEKAVITGYGAVGATGVGVESFWEGIQNGSGQAVEIPHLPADRFPNRWFYQVPEYPGYIPKQESQSFALCRIAGQEALANAGFDPNREELAITIGCTVGNLDTLENGSYGKHPHPVYFGALAAWLGKEFLAQAGTRIVSCACVSGLTALISAIDAIELGHCFSALVFGVDCYSIFGQASFTRANMLDTERAKPLLHDSKGLIMGAGAGAVLIEKKDYARKKGRMPIASILGRSINNDIYSPVAATPGGERLANCIEDALFKARLHPEDIGLILSHASGIALADEMEKDALTLTFGEFLEEKLILNVKAHLGHTNGASTILTLVAGLLAKRMNFVPPVAERKKLIRDTCRKLPLSQGEKFPSRSPMLAIGYGIGGSNAAVVLDTREVS